MKKFSSYSVISGLSIILSLSVFLILSSNIAYADENAEENLIYASDVIEDGVNQGEDSVIEYSYIDENNSEVSVTDITTFGRDQVLWNREYSNENSVKKEIYARNYGLYAKPGTVNVRIKNTGRTTIKVNIYQSWWNSNTIAYDSISPGSSRTFVIGPEHGGYDCTTNTCFAYHKFTISAYSDSGKISFIGNARIYY